MPRLFKPHWLPFLLLAFSLQAQNTDTQIFFTVDISDPSAHYFDIEMIYQNPRDLTALKMCAWTPGSYTIHDYGQYLERFSVTNERGVLLPWKKSGVNTWLVTSKNSEKIIARYRIKATRLFIENSYIDDRIGIISPASTFLYIDEELDKSVKVRVNYPSGKKIATGLDLVDQSQNIYYAENYDKLLDCPFLLGELEYLPVFYIKEVPHYFIGYEIGKLDRKLFIEDLEKISAAGVAVFGDIPFQHYSYLSYGYGPGGLEHTNSCIVSFRTKDILSTPEARMRNYKLLAHEYFHAYNPKRVRPIELGPFDYSGPNYTKLLWFAEGVTDYYAHLMLKRAGIVSMEELNRSFQNIIRNYENKPGHKYQSLTDASLTVWTNSPFSKTKEQADRSISYYEKGCIAGLLIDFDIRHRSKNRYSLDDVMKSLYQKYYQNLGRGFTDEELKAECESFAGSSMDEVFSYTSSTAPVDYQKYFGYAGLQIDTTLTKGSYLGCTTGMHDREYLPLNSVEEGGPAWNSGLRVGDQLLAIEGREPNLEVLYDVLLLKKPGDILKFDVRKVDGKEEKVSVKLGSKEQRTFAITIKKKRSDLQNEILKSWSEVRPSAD